LKHRSRGPRAKRTSTTPAVRALILAGVAAITFVTFAPSLQNHFVDWDDPDNFITNPYYRGFGATQLMWMWTTVLLGHYVPLTWMTLGLDFLVWGLNPAGYHLTNVLLHTANATLVYLIARRLLRVANPVAVTRDLLAWRLSAAFAALLFAVHPLRVESVAWVTERRDVLSGLFYLLAIWAYLRDAEAAIDVSIRQRVWYWISLGCFVLALFSKAITVTLPIVLIVLDVYPLRRLGSDAGGFWSPQARRRWAEKVPFILAGAAMIPVALVAARSGASLLAMAGFGILDRLAVSVYGLAFYLWKTVVPLGLSPFYSLKTPVAPASLPYLVSGSFVLGITAIAILLRRHWPALCAVWPVYVVTLLPVSGILQNGPQIAADRYSYLPSLSWAMLAGAGALTYWQAWNGREHSRAIAISMTGVAALVVAVLIVLSWQQVGVWRDPERLWSHALAIAPSSVVHEHMGYVRRQQGRLAEAIEHYRTASALRPAAAHIRIQWGNTLAQHGMFGAAIDRYREAIDLTPDSAAPHNNWGNALVAAGRPEEAISHYREAARIDPSDAEAHNNWGRALAQQGRWEEAIAEYREALRLKPHSVPYYNWGNALFAAGRFEEATSQYQAAVRIDPSAAEAYNNWGRALAEQGRWDEAVVKYREALRLKPNYPLASANLEQALSRAPAR
jgi:tetratricopeptide (TPR) repeat protein